MTTIARPRAIRAKGKKRKCMFCKRLLRKIPMDNGTPRERRKRRGRPPRNIEPNRLRYEHIGWWCKSCRIFHYLDEDVPKVVQKILRDIFDDDVVIDIE